MATEEQFRIRKQREEINKLRARVAELEAARVIQVRRCTRCEHVETYGGHAHCHAGSEHQWRYERASLTGSEGHGR